MSNDNNYFMQNLIIISATILSLACLVILITIAVSGSDQALSEDQIASLTTQTQPAGSIRYQASEQQQPAAVTTPVVNQAIEEPEINPGQQIYDTVCTNCHSTGLPNVPQLGNAADWEARIAQGEMIFENAINGYTGSSGMMMPPKGGNPALSDEEVRAAVDYIIESSQ